MSLRENPRMQKLSSSGDLTRRLRRRINRHLQLPWLRITQEVTAALASPPYGKWIFPVFHRSGVPVWLCRDGYRSSLWLCVSYNGSPVLVIGSEATRYIFIRQWRIGDINHTGYPLLWRPPAATTASASSCLANSPASESSGRTGRGWRGCRRSLVG